MRSAPDGPDQVFRLSLHSAGLLVLLIMGTVGLFLFYKGADALAEAGLSFLTTQAWEPDSHHFGVATVIVGTLLIAAVAVTFAVPLATGVALYISEYAPRRLRRALTNVLDLMAAVPGWCTGCGASTCSMSRPSTGQMDLLDLRLGAAAGHLRRTPRRPAGDRDHL